MRRSAGSSSTRLVSQRCATRCSPSAGVRPPFADDVEHYERLLSRHTRLDARRGARGRAGRAPDPRARIRVAARRRRRRVRLGGVRALARGAAPGRARRLLRRRRAVRHDARPLRPQALARPDDAPAPARARGPARAALPRPQDPGRASRTITDVGTPIDDLRAAVGRRRGRAAQRGARPTFTLERPRKAGFGDFSTNAAMLLAPALKAPPREIAERLGEGLTARLGDRVERVEVAGPGFLNLFLADAWYTDAAAHVLAAGDAWGGGVAEPAERVLIEFVSANPTGPLTAASGRHAAYGDALRAAARARRPRGRARVLLQRRGLPAAQARRVDPRSRARRGAARGRLPGRVRRRAGAADPGRGRARRRGAGRRRRPAADRAHQGDARALPRDVRHLVLGADAARGRPESAVERAFEQVERAGHSYRVRGRAVAAHDAFGDDKDRVLVRSHRRSDLLRRRPRVPRGQARARLRPPHHAARAPTTTATSRRLKARDGQRWAATRTGSRSRSCSSSTSSSAAGAPRCPSGAATSSRSTS